MATEGGQNENQDAWGSCRHGVDAGIAGCSNTDKSADADPDADYDTDDGLYEEGFDWNTDD